MIKNLENKREKIQESINKDIEELKNKHRETNTITEIKNTLEGINSRIPEAEEWISDLKDKTVEIDSEEQNKVKRMKRTVKGSETVFEEMIAESFPNMGKETLKFRKHKESYAG